MAARAPRPHITITFQTLFYKQRQIRSYRGPLAEDMSKESQQRQSLFFILPAELRNVIYQDVLGDLSTAYSCFGGINYVRPRPLSLLFVSRQIYQEVRLLPYSMNSITAGPRTKFRDWIGRRTQDQIRAITRLHFVFDSPYLQYDTLQRTVTNFGYSRPNNVAVESLLHAQLAFPEMSGLRYILIELRSCSGSPFEVPEQIEILSEVKRQMKASNPQTEVTATLTCLSSSMRWIGISASPTDEDNLVRFSKLIEDEKRPMAREGYLELDVKRVNSLRSAWRAAIESQMH